MSLLIPVAIGAGLLLLASGKGGGSTPSGGAPPSSAPKTALDFQNRIATALSQGDAAELMRIADAMQAAGLTAEAQALRTSAQSLQALGALGSDGKPPTVTPGQPVVLPTPALPNPPVAPPPVVYRPPTAPPPFVPSYPSNNPQPAQPQPQLPQVVLPPLVVPSTVPLQSGQSLTPEQQDRLANAQAMALNLRNTSKYQESKPLVVRFQAQESLVADGLYGPKSGLALVKYGIVPPRPRYWSTKTMREDKASWTARMLQEAARDPSRAADWTAASKVQNDPAR